MNKFCKLLTGILSTAVLCACSANESKADKDSNAETSLTSDSVATTQIEETGPVAVLNTPDLAFAEVCGNVKSVKMNNTTLQFDEEGNLTSGLQRLKRDKEGRISKWGYDEYFVTWENDRPKTYKVRESDGGTMTHTYFYDKDGCITKEIIYYDLPGDEQFEETVTYTYDKDSFDDRGNWITRTCNYKTGSEKQKRTITYY